MSDPLPDESEDRTAGPLPLLGYERRDVDLTRATARRKQIPRPAGIGFVLAAVALAAFWVGIDSSGRLIPHVALFTTGTVALAGLSLTAWPPTRLAGAGVLVALGVWLLLLGVCSGIGFVRPGVF